MTVKLLIKNINRDNVVASNADIADTAQTYNYLFNITSSGTVLEPGTSAALVGQAIVPPWIISNQGMLQSAQGEGVLIFSSRDANESDDH